MNRKTQIPLFRAKKIDSDEWVIGYLMKTRKLGSGTISYYLQSPEIGMIDVDISTLAIHFPDMLDRDGNKIFASLSEEGKGGDICSRKYDNEKYIAIYMDYSFKFIPINKELFYDGIFYRFNPRIKTIGIHQ